YGDLSDPAAIYSATIANTDRAIGRLLDKLQGIGQPDDTLIIYSSDNGSYRADRVGHLRGTKGSNYEGGIRVPGIFHWPKHIQAGARTSEPAGLVDILATVCGLVGLKQPSVQLDGSDLSNFLTGVTNKVTRKQPLFWFLPLAGPAVAMRDGRYSMVAYRDGIIPKDHAAIAAIKQQIEALLRNRGTFETETRGSTFAKQLFEGFADRDAEKLRGQFIRLNQFHESWIPKLKQGTFTRFELYDLQQDPSQKRNLSTQFPRLHARMKAELQRIAASAMQEAFDWSAGQPIPDQAVDPAARVHRLQSTFR
ncbi:MAG: sulfatase-like hydrolase/transferase, partial [Planctomycetaceae bacterium]|nr:sulfatase-like hydrolase/transferase [Planctomycetaceae bacterium]